MDDDRKAVNMAQGIKSRRENMITRAKFLALVAQGFSERQALDLCKRYAA